MYLSHVRTRYARTISVAIRAFAAPLEPFGQAPFVETALISVQLPHLLVALELLLANGAHRKPFHRLLEAKLFPEVFGDWFDASLLLALVG